MSPPAPTGAHGPSNSLAKDSRFWRPPIPSGYERRRRSSSASAGPNGPRSSATWSGWPPVPAMLDRPLPSKERDHMRESRKLTIVRVPRSPPPPNAAHGARSGWSIVPKHWHKSGAKNRQRGELRAIFCQFAISAIGSAFPVVLLFVMCFAVGGALARLNDIHREPEQAFEAEKRTATHESLVRDAKFLKGQEAIM